MPNTPQDFESPPATDDRRRSARRQVASLAYVELGKSNGGIILNISENGLAVASASALEINTLSRVRFQLPGSLDWLEVSGEIAWISKSNREFGIRFVDLSDDARKLIKGWMVSDVSSVQVRGERAALRERARERFNTPVVSTPQGRPTQPENFRQATQADERIPIRRPNAAPTFFSPRGPAVPPPPSIRRKILARRQRWAIFAAAVILGGFVTFWWFKAGPGTKNPTLGQVEKSNLDLDRTVSGAETSPTSSPGGLAPSSLQNESPRGDESTVPSSSTTGELSGAPVSSRRAEAAGNEPVSASRSAKVVNPSTQIARSQEPVSPPGSVSTLANASNPQAESTPPLGPVTAASPPTAASATPPPSGNANQPEETRSSTTPQGSSLPSTSAPSPAVPKSSISVSMNPYPSIRAPSGLTSPLPGQGANLQIGRLLSRVDPIYPEEAETQRLEGTVKLHVIIGQDGSIQSVEPRSGPMLLVAAATNAVRQWRYTPSYVGSQPVEAEEDITMTFRLPKQTVQPRAFP
jgi:TonB family protein